MTLLLILDSELALIASGGVTVTGSVEMTVSYTSSLSGGVAISGSADAADVTPIYDYFPTGGVIFGGGAKKTYSFIVYWDGYYYLGKYYRKQFVASGSNVRRRKNSSGSGAYLPAITICNQELTPYFEANRFKELVVGGDSVL